MSGLEHLTPVEVLRRMDEIQERIAKGLIVCDEAFGAWQDAELAFDTAEAEAYLAETGPVHERKYRVVLATQEQRREMNVRLRALKRADRLMRHLESDLSRWQTTNKNVMQAYQVAGVVER